ncbi:hypothetical protein M3P21_00355 [Ruegeria sp. 2012CJ41-6]|uniref:FkbM family methyltransferase n=1 Tax=Ruegeria spongiae TaxID=2942209 RepID=A0ABT0PWL7_9RHOB|nr:hypothetical protein [Ruegeria spongiae]MCL6281971.1 hypothetical protein [Ruegeria spongiae]
MNSRHFWILRKVLKRATDTSREQVKTYRILGDAYGQYDSMEKWDCRDGSGREIPWYTYPAIEYLNNFDLGGARVLEYGSGNSSIYYLNAGAVVTSIEHDPIWSEKVRASVANNANFTYVFEQSESGYAERAEVSDADIIVIDGKFRNTCARHVIKNIVAQNADPALIIFDNSDRNPVVMALLDEGIGWHRCDFNGFGPINAYTWTTSIYLNPSRALKRKGPLDPVGGLKEISPEDH